MVQGPHFRVGLILGRLYVNISKSGLRPEIVPRGSKKDGYKKRNKAYLMADQSLFATYCISGNIDGH